MKFSAFLFLFLFPFLILKAQKSNSFVVEYGVEYRGIMMDTAYFSDKDQKAMIVKLEKMKERALAYDESYVKLKVNDKYAALERIPIMTKDDEMYSAERASNFLFPFIYRQNENKLCTMHEVNGKEYCIEDSRIFNWEITKETKKIISYECIKAIHKYEVKGKQKEIIVWFTPNIPVGVGPVRYRGLPGLILGVEYFNNTRYIYARNISFKESIDIKIPNKDKIITEEKAKELRGW
ncbi:GLPGLI family protein [Mesonia aquimarina]|uniref:GLPGLI family protein n=1 Tax=Mesonia aquimarina TaxID=1504967 RepID=UPI000EF61D7C|nr:GLPGLI family protein [Mesonia aquimarina]